MADAEAGRDAIVRYDQRDPRRMGFQVPEVAEERVRTLAVRNRLVVRVAFDEIRVKRENGISGEIPGWETRRGTKVERIQRHGIVVIVGPGRRRDVFAERAAQRDLFEQRALGR